MSVTKPDPIAAALDNGADVVPTILQPSPGWRAVHFQELWDFRELLWTLAMRDIRVRYKQTLLGAAWAVIQPLLSTFLFTLIFAYLAKMSTDGQNPLLFYFSGMLPWQLFSNALTQAGNSLVENKNLITKIYFPRLIVPMATVAAGLVDFLVALGMLAVLMVVLAVFPPHVHTLPPWQVIFLPAFLLLALMAALGVGLWLSALNVEYRDVRYIMPFITQFWLYATPVAYPASLFHAGWMRTLLGLNPMSGVVTGFRWCLLGTPLSAGLMITNAVTIAVILFGGVYYFRRLERGFADIV